MGSEMCIRDRAIVIPAVSSSEGTANGGPFPHHVDDLSGPRLDPGRKRSELHLRTDGEIPAQIIVMRAAGGGDQRRLDVEEIAHISVEGEAVHDVEAGVEIDVGPRIDLAIDDVLLVVEIAAADITCTRTDACLLYTSPSPRDS